MRNVLMSRSVPISTRTAPIPSMRSFRQTPPVETYRAESPIAMPSAVQRSDMMSITISILLFHLLLSILRSGIILISVYPFAVVFIKIYNTNIYITHIAVSVAKNEESCSFVPMRHSHIVPNMRNMSGSCAQFSITRISQCQI